MKRALIVCTLVAVIAAGCKSSKEAKAEKQARNMDRVEAQTEEVERASVPEVEEEEAPPAEEVRRRPRPQEVDHEPTISENHFFGMYRTPCFGQCPTYNLDIMLDGSATLEGIRFFDYIGMHETKLNEDQMDAISALAEEYGYFQMEHEYDAPVTDLPSTTTFLRSEEGVHWVYNRMNAPDELRKFEQEVETIIKDLQWSPVKGKED